MSFGTRALQDFLKNQRRQSDRYFRIQYPFQLLNCRPVNIP